MISTEYTYDLSWEEVFAQATEDVSTFVRAVKDWPESSEGYSQDYLLLMILSYRARTALALQKMDTAELPEEYLPYAEQMKKLFGKGEKLLRKISASDAGLMEKIVSNELKKRAENLLQSLQKIRSLVQQGYLMEDEEWVEDDLRETEHDFILDFQELSLCRKELGSPLFQNAVNARSFTDPMKSAENKFRAYFGYFHVIADILASVRNREYNPPNWWFTEIPDENEVPEPGISPETAENLFQAYKTLPDMPGKCPAPEEIIAYAFDELAAENNPRIRKHLAECRNCLNLVMNLREADRETADVEETEVMPALMSAIQKRPVFEEIADTLSSLSQKAKTIIEHTLSATLELFQWEPALESMALRGGGSYEEVPVKNGDILHSGDRFSITFKADQDSYVYLLFKDSAGEIIKLSEQKADSQERYELGPIQLDNNTGEESILMLTSAFPIENLEERMEQIKVAYQQHTEIQTLFSDIAVNIITFQHK